MAENESLDISNRRFRWIVADLSRQVPPSDVAQRLIKKLCGAWTSVRKHGFNVADVISLAITGSDLAAAIRDTGGSDLAHLIKLHAQPMCFPGSVLEKVNRSAIEQVIDSGIQKAICYENGPTVLTASHIKQQIMAFIDPVIPSLTDLLLGSDKRVRAPKIPPITTSLPQPWMQMPAALLEQSLLTPAQRLAKGA